MLIRIIFLCASLLITRLIGSCSALFNISIDTVPLVGHPAGPFSLNFQFTDGSSRGDANNTLQFEGFNFGPGGPSGTPSYVGGASGTLSSAIALTDSSFLNEFTQTFLPGAMLNFQLSLTTTVDRGAIPDEFSFAILDSSGVEIPTLGPANALIVIDIDSTFPSLSTFPTNTSVPPIAGGPPINIAAPTITLVNVPEPGSFVLLATGCTALLFLIRRKCSRIL